MRIEDLVVRPLIGMDQKRRFAPSLASDPKTPAVNRRRRFEDVVSIRGPRSPIC